MRCCYGVPSSALVLVVLLVVASPVEAQRADPTHQAEELANRCQQDRERNAGLPAECVTSTATPRLSDTAAPTPTPTPTITITPAPEQATATPSATPGPPCWTDDNGDRWLVVDGAVYFDSNGDPMRCPSPVDPNTTPEPTEAPAPFVEPTAVFVPPVPTPVIQIITQIVREIQVVHDAPLVAAAATDTPTPIDTPTDTPTPVTPEPTPTPELPEPTPTTILPWTETPTALPTRAQTPEPTRTAPPPKLPPVAQPVPSRPLPPAPPWQFLFAGGVTSDRKLWPMALIPPLPPLLSHQPVVFVPRYQPSSRRDRSRLSGYGLWSWQIEHRKLMRHEGLGGKSFTRFEKPSLLYVEGNYAG